MYALTVARKGYGSISIISVAVDQNDKPMITKPKNGLYLNVFANKTIYQAPKSNDLEGWFQSRSMWTTEDLEYLKQHAIKFIFEEWN